MQQANSRTYLDFEQIHYYGLVLEWHQKMGGRVDAGLSRLGVKLHKQSMS